MKSEGEMLKTLGLVTSSIAFLIAITIASILCTSCSAIDKNKAEIEKIADDVANELIEDAIQKVEKK